MCKTSKYIFCYVLTPLYNAGWTDESIAVVTSSILSYNAIPLNKKFSITYCLCTEYIIINTQTTHSNYAHVTVLLPDAATFSKRNEDHIICTLDLYPTLWNIVHSVEEDRDSNSNSTWNVSLDKYDYISGSILIGTTIPTDRGEISCNYFSQKFSFLVLANQRLSILKRYLNLVSINYNEWIGIVFYESSL